MHQKPTGQKKCEDISSSFSPLLSQVEVSPLENAISVVENKNQELRTLISQYQHKQLHGNINLLSMTLNGVIDAAVNGGIARYQEVWETVSC